MNNPFQAAVLAKETGLTIRSSMVAFYGCHIKSSFWFSGRGVKDMALFEDDEWSKILKEIKGSRHFQVQQRRSAGDRRYFEYKIKRIKDEITRTN